MAAIELPFRQIHLDFHTSGDIPGIAADFDPDDFAATMERARVNSVTCFARCCHGWMYYDSKRFPGRVHPGLKRRNLLERQIAALHKRGIRAPIYVAIQWDHLTVEQHPEWLMLQSTGAPEAWNLTYEPGFCRTLCLNTAYVDELLMPHVEELLRTMPVDGFFFDVLHAFECSCGKCRRDMLAAGLDPTQPEVRKQFSTDVIHRFERKMTAMVRKHSKDCTIFYNCGHISTRHRPTAEVCTHLEIESLPTGGWGYLHFPTTVRYARTLKSEMLGMTGKFHTTWGDFHSFKNAAALEFECFTMLAHGAKCSIGDQLLPHGRLCDASYDLIGGVYRQVEAKEPWCRGATARTDIGVLSAEAFLPAYMSQQPESSLGVTSLLQEGAHQFNFIDPQADLADYRLLILPDEIPVSPELAAALSRYLRDGGALIATHRSGLAPDGRDFALGELGVRLVGPAPFSPDYLVPRGDIGRGLPSTEHVMYMQGLQVATRGRAKVLADVKVPYFNRDWRHYCSHGQTPSSGKVGYPGVVRNGRTIYFAHPIFNQYHANTPHWCKRVMLNAIDLLLEQPLVRLTAPSTAIATVTTQRRERRDVLHLLHYVPQRRGASIDIIEDVLPLHDVGVSFREDRPIRRVTCVPQGQPLAFERADGRVDFTLPKLEGHQMIEIA